MLNKILRGVILTGIFLVPFIPLYVANTMFFPFITGKNFVFRVIVEIIFAVWAILALRDNSYLPKKSLILYSVGAFLAVMTVADIFGASFYRSFWSNYERMEGLVALLHMCAYFFVLGSVLNTDKLWDRYMKTILGAGCLIVLYAMGQLAGFFVINQGFFRVDATFGNSTYLAVHMLFLAFISAIYAYRSGYLGNKSSFSKYVYTLLCLVYIFILYKTATRGALIGLILGILVTAIILLYRGGAKIRKVSASVVLVFVALLGVFYLARNSSFIKGSFTLNRFTEVSWQQIAREPRLMVWGMAIDGFKENPILGWGQDNFNLVFNKYYNPGMYGQEPWFDRAHDVFFDWLAAGGLLGLLAYLSVFGAAIFVIWRRSDSLKFTLVDKALFTGMLVAYFVQNIFVFDNLMSYTLFFTILAYLHFGSKESAKGVAAKLKNDNSEEAFFLHLISSLVLVGLVFGLYFINVKPILTSRSLIRALSSQDLKQGLDYFKEALSYKTFGTTEAREQLAQRSLNLRGLNIDNAMKIEYFNLAKDELLKQIESSPDDARYRVFLTSLLNRYGFQDAALEQAEKAVLLSPRKQTIIFELVAVYVNRKEYDKALETAKFAYDLEPNFGEAQKIYATVAIYAKRDEDRLIQDLIIKNFGDNIPTDDRFVSAYASVGRYDKVTAIWRKKTAKDPNNSQLHLSLAASLLAENKRSASIAELETVIRLKPDFKATAEHFIGEIRAGRNP